MRKFDIDDIAKFANQAKDAQSYHNNLKISFNLRLPVAYFDALRAQAKDSKESMNSLIVNAIKKIYFS